MPAPRSRLEHLDGLRGYGAVVVVLWHCVLAFFPFWMNGPGAVLELPLSHVWFSPFRSLFNGPFAVSVFFVLSGFVLSHGYFSNGRIDQLSSAFVRRYFRLTVPALASCLFAWGLMKAGAIHPRPSSDLHVSDWLARWYLFGPDLVAAIREGLGVAVVGIDWANTYNNVLWTMHGEFLGSLVVFAILALAGNLRCRWIVYGVVALAFFPTRNLPCISFIVGMALSDWAHARYWETGKYLSSRWTGLALFVAGLWLGGCDSAILPNFVRMAGAAFCLAGCVVSPDLKTFLSLPVSRFLGQISFGLYLVHVPLLYAVGCPVFFRLLGSGSTTTTAGTVATLAILLASVPAGWVLAKTADPWSIALGKWIYQRLFQPAVRPDLHVSG